MKNLFGRFYSASGTENIFKTLSLLKISDIHRLYVSIYMYRAFKLDDLPLIRNSINLTYPDHLHYTRHRNLAELPFPHVKAIRINYQYQFVHIWNSLPENIRDCETLPKFKRELTEYFLSNY